MARLKSILKKNLFLLLAAALVNVLVAWLCATMVDVTAGQRRAQGFMNGEVFWSVERWDRAGATYVVSSIIRDWPWSPSQATGPANTPQAGDRQTAWASATADGQREWLCLEFANAVVPKSVRVYENNAPGAIDRVTVFTADGDEVEAWHGKDPTEKTQASGVSEIPIAVSFATKKVKLHINSPAVRGWNEIDAVELKSTSGELQWATRATASSSYGAPASTAPSVQSVQALLPTWADVRHYRPVVRNATAPTDARAVDGRGWPLVALWCERDPVTGNAVAGALGGSTKPPTTTANAAQINSIQSSSTLVNGLYTGLHSTTPPTLRPVLPVHIAWQGFLANLAFYMLVLAALRWLIVRPWRLTVELSRLRNGCCIACGYDLGYEFAAGCPECGWRRVREKIRNPNDEIRIN